jgi:hypothetical protein
MAGSSEDNVLAKNENANTALGKRALSKARFDALDADEDPVNSEYGTCLE